MVNVHVVPGGDSTLTVEFPARIAPEINSRVLALAAVAKRRLASSLRDIVIGYCTLTVFFDPLRVEAAWIEDELRQAVADLPDEPAVASAVIDVPVCYGSELGPDLQDVAVFAGCSAKEAIALHTAETYRVYLLGFVPGFAYMAEVDARIAAPRRASPRSAVPAGSVAIAGGQTAIYPTDTPGGWNIIGRTPVKPYDPSRAIPFLFKPGDRVRFQSVDRAEYDRLA